MREDFVDQSLSRRQGEHPELDFSSWAITHRIMLLADHLRLSDHTSDDYALNRGAVDVLIALRRSRAEQRLSPTQICERLLITSATATSRLDKLEQDGFVTRTPNATDRRGMLIELTEKGRRIIDEIIARKTELRATQLTSFSDDERERLIELLRKLLIRFEDGAAGSVEPAAAAIPSP